MEGLTVVGRIVATHVAHDRGKDAVVPVGLGQPAVELVVPHGLGVNGLVDRLAAHVVEGAEERFPDFGLRGLFLNDPLILLC